MNIIKKFRKILKTVKIPHMVEDPDSERKFSFTTYSQSTFIVVHGSSQLNVVREEKFYSLGIYENQLAIPYFSAQRFPILLAEALLAASLPKDDQNYCSFNKKTILDTICDNDSVELWQVSRQWLPGQLAYFATELVDSPINVLGLIIRGSFAPYYGPLYDEHMKKVGDINWVDENGSKRLSIDVRQHI